jgi:hypothetical protein
VPQTAPHRRRAHTLPTAACVAHYVLFSSAMQRMCASCPVALALHAVSGAMLPWYCGVHAATSAALHEDVAACARRSCQLARRYLTTAAQAPSALLRERCCGRVSRRLGLMQHSRPGSAGASQVKLAGKRAVRVPPR